MKSKSASEIFGLVQRMTYGLDGQMTLTNPSTGEEVEVDVPTSLAVARGVLEWCRDVLRSDIGDILPDDAEDMPDPARFIAEKQTQRMLVNVAHGIAESLADETE